MENEVPLKETSGQYKAGWSIYLVLAGATVNLSAALPVGYNIGVVNTPADVIKDFCNVSFISRYDVWLSHSSMNVLWSFIVSIFVIGACIGSIIGSVLADMLGRKNATILANLISLIGALNFLLCRAANSVEMLIIGRLLVGLSGGLVTSIVPMYLSELAPLSLSGPMGGAVPVGINLGVFVGQALGLNFLLGGDDDWPYLLSFFSVLVLLCMPILIMLPESPKYLFVIKRDEKTASKALSRLRGVPLTLLEGEIRLLRDEVKTSQAAASERWSMLRVAADPRLRLTLLLCCGMQVGQQFSGINAVWYYSKTIFTEAGLSASSAQYGTIGCGFVNVCTACVMLYLLPRVGRRPLILISVFGSSCFMGMLCVTILFMNVVQWMPYMCMLAELFYVLILGFGLGPIPFFIASEMFEVAPRPAGMAWGSLANWGGNFLVGMSFPTMRDTLGPYSFLVFAVFSASLFVFLNSKHRILLDPGGALYVIECLPKLTSKL